MLYCKARYDAYNEDISYRAYITDILKALAEKQGFEVSQRWYENVSGVPQDTKSEAEVALDNFFSDLR